jgi:hypothetical protein
MSILVGPVTLSATGGTISSITGYKVHTFSTPGVSTFIPRQNGTIEVLVVGGGGAGSVNGGGGGGGGAVLYNKFVNATSGTPYPITVGAVGSPTGGISSCTFNNATIIAYGGGAGGDPNLSGISSPNASGGGGALTGNRPGGVGAGITGLGFPGAQGGGGGGAGGAAPGYGGPGGIGISYSITGTSQYYGGGGTSVSGFPSPGTPGAVIIRYPV